MCVEVQDIRTQIHAVLDPLFKRLGLLECFEYRQAETVFSILFQSKDIGLEVNVDLADFFIYTLLFKPKGSEIPDYEDEIYVQEALDQIGVDIKAVTQKLQQLGGDYRNCSKMLAIIKEIIEAHWSTLLAKRNRWFGDNI